MRSDSWLPQIFPKVDSCSRTFSCKAIQFQILFSEDEEDQEGPGTHSVSAKIGRKIPSNSDGRGTKPRRNFSSFSVGCRRGPGSGGGTREESCCFLPALLCDRQSLQER